jgi:PhnB protein
MKQDWKPQGYNAVSVYVVADGAQALIDFLKTTFDAQELRRFDNPDGKIMHAEVRIADTVVMIADSGGSYPSMPAWLHVYVPDADFTYKAALKAGGVAVQEPVRKEHDTDKRGGFKDPVGNTWWVATQVAS